MSRDLRSLLHPVVPGAPLLVGHGLPPWADVPEAERVGLASERTPRRRDLIVLDLDSGSPDAPPSHTVDRLRRDLTPEGRLFVLLRNRFSYAALRDELKPNKRVRTTRRASPWRLRRELHEVGFPKVRGFLCLPDARGPEEFVATDGGMVHLPSYAPPALRLALKLGVYSRVHDGHLFLCGNQAGAPLLPILGALENELPGPGGSLHLHRFDLRERGAMVFFVGRRLTRPQYVVRIPMGDNAARIGRSYAAQASIHEDPTIPLSVRSRVPKPITRFSLFGRQVFVEPMAHGILAWKVAGSPLESTIVRRAHDFALELAKATSDPVVLDDEILFHLFEADVARAGSASLVAPELTGVLMRVIDDCRSRLKGLRVNLSRSHGDYGLGNIIAHPKTGELEAVIDWDTSRERELPGIDILNFEVQREHGAGGLGAALQRVRNRLLYGEEPEAINAVAQLTPGLSPEGRTSLLGVCLVRFVTRALEYPQIVARQSEELLDALASWPLST